MGGIPDAIEGGKSGILVATKDYQSMTNAVVSLLQNDAKRLEMGAFAQRRAREEFAWDSVVSRYDQMINSLI